MITKAKRTAIAFTVLLAFAVIKAIFFPSQEALSFKDSNNAPEGTITASEDAEGSVQVFDQNGREISVQEMLSWKPEVEIEQQK